MGGCPAVLRRIMSICDRDPRSLEGFDQEAVLANRKFSGVYAWRADLGYDAEKFPYKQPQRGD
jgi:hypothetical protein